MEDETLGGFLLKLAKKKPDVSISAILKWNFGAMKTLFRGTRHCLGRAAGRDQEHPVQARRSPSAGLQPSSEDRRDRRLLRDLRRHRHDGRPLGPAGPCRRRSRPHSAERQALRSLARCDHGRRRAAGARRLGNWRAIAGSGPPARSLMPARRRRDLARGPRAALSATSSIAIARTSAAMANIRRCRRSRPCSST